MSGHDTVQCMEEDVEHFRIGWIISPMAEIQFRRPDWLPAGDTQNDHTSLGTTLAVTQNRSGMAASFHHATQ